MSIVKKPSEKRYNRVNISLTDQYDAKLKKLAVSCNMHHTTLAEIMVRFCLDSTNIIYSLQEDYNINPEYKIIPVRENGELKFVLK